MRIKEIESDSGKLRYVIVDGDSIWCWESGFGWSIGAWHNVREVQADLIGDGSYPHIEAALYRTTFMPFLRILVLKALRMEPPKEKKDKVRWYLEGERIV